MVTIRPAKIKDAKAIAKLDLEMMHEHRTYDKILQVKKNAIKFLEERYKKLTRSWRTKLLVAEDDGEIVGFISVTIKERPKIYEVEKMGFIGGIYVKPKYRRKGISKKFMKLIFEWLKSKGVFYVDLFVATKNDVAMSVWKSHKFKEFLKEKYRRI